MEIEEAAEIEHISDLDYSDPEAETEETRQTERRIK